MDSDAMQGGDEYAIVIDNLVKRYGNLTAVNDISLKVKKGSLFAFLGVNGAGKSTTINIVCSIIPKDSGKIYVNGYDLDEDQDKIKKEIGVMYQTSVLDKELTVKQNLEIRTSFYSMPKVEKRRNIDRIVHLLHLEPIMGQAVKTLSGGQLRRVDIARALVHNPRLLILDEPTTGLDPQTRLDVWSIIDDIRKNTSMTVFLTTHYLEEADKASDVVIMDKGNIIARGTPNELKNRYSTDNIVVYMEKNEEFEKAMVGDGRKFSYDDEHGIYRIPIRDTAEAKSVLKSYDDYITDAEILKGNMDDVFLTVTGRNIENEGEEDGDGD